MPFSEVESRILGRCSYYNSQLFVSAPKAICYSLNIASDCTCIYGV